MPRVIITVPDNEPQPYRFPLDRSEVSIGRSSGNDIVLASGSVSGQHAKMRRTIGGFELKDLGSTNGIKFEGYAAEALSLSSGMKLMLGDVSFFFELTEEETKALADELPVTESLHVAEKTTVLPRPPARRRAASREENQYPFKEEIFLQEKYSGMGFGAVLLFLMFVALAFVGGMSIRHQKETGESLFSGISNKWSGTSPAAAEDLPAK